jgi:hypothetical protein
MGDLQGVIARDRAYANAANRQPSARQRVDQPEMQNWDVASTTVDG